MNVSNEPAAHSNTVPGICFRKLDVLQRSAKEISEATGNVVIPIQVDVRDPESVGKALDTVVSQLGLPHVVVNNAAGNFVAPTERLSSNACKTIIDIVLNGTLHVTLDVGKRLINAKQGMDHIYSHIVFLFSSHPPLHLLTHYTSPSGASFLAISASYAQVGSGYVMPSAVAKAGVEAMSKYVYVGVWV